MTKLIEAATRIEAWLQACDHLLPLKHDLNVILSIAQPGIEGELGKRAAPLVDAFLAEEEEYPLHTVAETIFPAWEYTRRGIRGVYTVYADESYPVLKSGDPQKWGTYAQRLLRRTTANGTIVNPLEGLIAKLRAERVTRGTKHACYELGIAEGAFDMPLYDTVADRKRRRGGPCLSHLSFKQIDGTLHLTALYRSHCYRYKALGNLLGLARLQQCVATEAGLQLGSLVVHSTYATLGESAERMTTLLQGIRRPSLA